MASSSWRRTPGVGALGVGVGVGFCQVDRSAAPGSQSAGASSKPSNRKPGATTHDTRVHVAERLGRLPLAGRDDHLRKLTGFDVSTEDAVVHLRITGRDRQPQRSAVVIQPQLVGVDSMPVRPFALPQQEVDPGAGGPLRPHQQVRATSRRTSHLRDGAAARACAMSSSASMRQRYGLGGWVGHHAARRGIGAALRPPRFLTIT